MVGYNCSGELKIPYAYIIPRTTFCMLQAEKGEWRDTMNVLRLTMHGAIFRVSCKGEIKFKNSKYILCDNDSLLNLIIIYSPPNFDLFHSRNL